MTRGTKTAGHSPGAGRRPGECRRLPIIALALVIVLGTLAGGLTCRQEASNKPTVVATIFPLADFVKNVAGDRVEVVTLLSSGDSPHVYEPTPGDMKAVAGALLLVVNGAGLDFWAERLKSAAGDHLAVLDTSVALAEAGLLLSGGEDDEHGGVNPHYWLDPALAQKQVEAIASALAEADPEGRDLYLENTAGYIDRLRSMDEEIAAETRSFARRDFIAFHPAWTYFARRYGLVEAAVIEEAPGKEPSAQYIMGVVDVAREHHIAAIFAEPQFSTKAAEAIAADSGAKVLLLDPLGGPGLKGRDSYLALMRYNTDQMAEAMA